MRKESVSRNTAPTGYVLSQEGHLLFLRIGHHLQLLDRMTHAQVVHDVPGLALTPDELLTHLFLLLRDVEAVRSEIRRANKRLHDPGSPSAPGLSRNRQRCASPVAANGFSGCKRIAVALTDFRQTGR